MLNSPTGVNRPRASGLATDLPPATTRANPVPDGLGDTPPGSPRRPAPGGRRPVPPAPAGWAAAPAAARSMLQRLRTACDPERYQGDTLMMGGLFGICASIKLSTIIMTLVPGLILATGAVAVGVAVCLRGRQASAAPQPDKVQPMPELSNKQVGGLVAGALGVALLVRPQPQTALRYATYGGFLLSLAQFSDLRTQRLVGASLVVTGTALTAIACATSPAIGGSLIAAAAAIGGCYVATKLVDMALHLNLLGLRKQGFDTEWLDQLLNPTG